jgi:hypothetical protein
VRTQGEPLLYCQCLFAKLSNFQAISEIMEQYILGSSIDFHHALSSKERSILRDGMRLLTINPSCVIRGSASAKIWKKMLGDIYCTFEFKEIELIVGRVARK